MLQKINECVRLCRRLTALLEEDRDELSSYMKGELFQAYQEVNMMAEDKVKDLEKRLLMLQSELMLKL